MAVRTSRPRAGWATAETHVRNVDEAAAQLFHRGAGKLAAPTVARDLHVVLVVEVQLRKLLARVFVTQVHGELVRARVAVARAGAAEYWVFVGRFEGADEGGLVA